MQLSASGKLLCQLIRKDLSDDRPGPKDYICINCGRGITTTSLPIERTCKLGSDKACGHRGAEIRLVECETCSNKTRIKVFACDLHGECSLQRNVGVKVCVACPDHTMQVRLRQKCQVHQDRL